jgi:hypothetical protein
MDPDEYLAHYGVKGMKWGVRRAAGGVADAGSSVRSTVKDAVNRQREKNAVTKAERKANFESARDLGYTPRMRNQDIDDIGIRGVRRVEKRVANGERIGTARFKESMASTARGLAVGTAILATPVAIGATSQGLSNLSSNINAKRGEKAAAKLLADTKGLTSYKTVSLSYNAAKDSWD